MRRFSRGSRRFVTSVPARTSSYQLVPARTSSYQTIQTVYPYDWSVRTFGRYVGTYHEIAGTGLLHPYSRVRAAVAHTPVRQAQKSGSSSSKTLARSPPLNAPFRKPRVFCRANTPAKTSRRKYGGIVCANSLCVLLQATIKVSSTV